MGSNASKSSGLQQNSNSYQYISVKFTSSIQMDYHKMHIQTNKKLSHRATVQSAIYSGRFLCIKFTKLANCHLTIIWASLQHITTCC